MITEYDHLPAALHYCAWDWYQKVFAEIDELAANRHLMYRSEFADVCETSRISKFLDTTDDGTIIGMSVITNDLYTWPLISPRYFQRHWPHHFDQESIWYIGFVGVDRTLGVGRTTFSDLIGAMYPRVADSDGIFVMDFCTENVNRRLPALTRRVVGNLNPATILEQVDAQTFWVGQFGEQQ